MEYKDDGGNCADVLVAAALREMREDDISETLLDAVACCVEDELLHPKGGQS